MDDTQGPRDVVVPGLREIRSTRETCVSSLSPGLSTHETGRNESLI